MGTKRNPQKIKHVQEVLQLLSIFTGDERYAEISKDEIDEGGISMCEVADRLEKRGIVKGRESGIHEATIQAIVNMIKFGVPEEKILEEYTEEELEQAKLLQEQETKS